MAIYSIAQIQSLMRSVGWPENTIALGSAIFMAESSGRSDVIGTLANNEYSVGLAQINTWVHRTYSVEQLKNPVTNLREALSIYRLEGWRAWGSYTDGRYRLYLGASNQALGYPAPSVVPASATNSISALSSSALNAFQGVGGFFWNNWLLLLIGFGVLTIVVSVL